MNTETILKILQERIHSTIAATIGDDGHPQVRVIDIMLIEDGKPIFLTARGKAFYDQLINQQFIALSGVKEGCSISLRGKVRSADSALLEKAFEQNPYMQTIYPGTTRKALEMFELYEGQGEYFDLTSRPIYRQSFTIGGGEKTTFQYTGTSACSGCGLCIDICPQHCIERIGKKVRIQPEHCLHCGLCFERCPHKAVVPTDESK